MYRNIIIFLFCAWMHIQHVNATCSRIPYDARGARSPVDENFQILIDGNPTNYIPNQLYNVSLSCPVNLKFLSFTLAVETEDESESVQDKTGHFEILNDAEMRFRPGCENIVESTNTNTKNRIHVSWVAPNHPECGCVFIKAALVQQRDVWFIDDGFLTKRICPEEVEEINSLTPPLENCCACDEAKYEILLERRWSRNTHAKEFPKDTWRTRISEIIGASHVYSYRYWKYGELASEGMRDLAEHGATLKLEEEIRNDTQSGYVRTIIKAPGIPYRENVFGTTLANARVDPEHHQISLSAKIDPSPDWILGVAGLELCLKNCTWVERKVVNMYPWDIGIDSGPSYMSSNQPQVPPDVIRRITSSFPNDYMSPFYDITGAPIKPMGVLYITRKKLYVRECEEAPQSPLECATHPWNDWTDCSTRCGPGYTQRFRSYKNPALAASYNCEQVLEESRQCEGPHCGSEFESDNVEFNGQDSMAACRLTSWSAWSPCSKTCGLGIRTRSRDYYNIQAKPECQSINNLPLEETSSCLSSECGGAINEYAVGNLGTRRSGQGRTISGRISQRLNNQNQNSQSQDRDQNNQDWTNQGQNNQFWSSQDQSTQGWTNQDQNSQGGNSRNWNNQGWNSQSQNTQGWSNQDQNSQGGNSRNWNNQGWSSQSQNTQGWRDQDQNSQGGSSRNMNNQGWSSESQNTQGWNNQEQNSQGGNSRNWNNQGDSGQSQSQKSRGGNNRNWNNRQNWKSESNLPDINQQGYDHTNSNSNLYPVSNAYNTNNDNSYMVVQDYCYEMPTASTQPCLAKKVVLRNFWFFDHFDRKCKIFTTDNCDDSKNRFYTLNVCLDTCVIPLINLARSQGRDLESDQGYLNVNNYRN